MRFETFIELHVTQHSDNEFHLSTILLLNANFLISSLDHLLNNFLEWPHLYCTSSSCMRVINHNWSAMKQRHHPQSVAEISRHSVLSGDRIRQCETSSGSRHKDTDQCP